MSTPAQRAMLAATQAWWKLAPPLPPPRQPCCATCHGTGRVILCPDCDSHDPFCQSCDGIGHHWADWRDRNSVRCLDGPHPRAVVTADPTLAAESALAGVRKPQQASLF